MTHIFLVISLFLTVFPIMNHLFGAEVSPEYVLRGFQASRDKIRTLEFSAIGHLIEKDQTYGKLEGPVEIFGIFDFDNNKCRFERKEPCRTFDPKNTKKWTISEQGGKFIRTPERVIFWILDKPGESAVIHPTTSQPPTQIALFDPRLLGIAQLYTLQKPDVSYERFMKNQFSQINKFKIVKLRDSIYRISMEDLPARWHIDFDESLGHLPIQLEVTVDSPTQKKSKVLPQSTVSTTWTQCDGCWVPENIEMIERVGTIRTTTYKLQFSWKHVNRSVSDDVFKIRNLGLPDQTLVVGTEDGDSITHGRIGDKTNLAKGFPDDSLGFWQRWRVWTITSVVIVGISIWYIRRRDR